MAEIPAGVEAGLARLRAENARLLRLLMMTPGQAAPPGPGQAAFFEAPPGWWRHQDRDYLPLTPGVLAAHLKGEVTSGCTRCWMVTGAGGWRPTSTGRTRWPAR